MFVRRLPVELLLCGILAAVSSGCETPGAIDVDRSVGSSEGAGRADADALPYKTSTTQLTAFHRSGQTFITWPEDTSNSGETYNVYRSTRPISSSTLSSATRIATVGEDSGSYRNEIDSGDPYQSRYIIEDFGEQLPSGVGLHVHTTQETGPVTEYYAVTEVRNGVEQSLQPNMTLGTGVTEREALPRPVIVYSNGVKTLYTHWMDYAAWNPKYEGYAYNFWVGVPASGNDSPLPLQMHLHAWGESWQRYWYAGDAYGSGSPYNVPTVWIEPDDARNTWWYGFANNVSRGQAPNASSTIVNYTEQRLLYYFDWITGPDSPYLIDSDRINLYGGSMGGAGALTFGLRHPELFAGVYCLVGMTDEASSSWGRGGFDTLWGTVSQNLPTNEGIGVHDRLDMLQYLDDHQGEDLPFTVSFHGRYDTTIEWTTQGLPWVDARGLARIPGPVAWADSDHYSSFDIYFKDLFPNYHMEDYTLRRAESYLVFTSAAGDDDPTGSIPYCRGSAPYNYGYEGNSIEWASSANPFMGMSEPLDTVTDYQVAIRLRSDLCNLPDSGTATVTLHRAQAFKPSSSTVVTWENRSSSGSLLQAGTIVPDSSGRISVPGVQVSKAGSFLSLSSSGSGTADYDHDGYSVVQGDCNDSDPSIHPGAQELCDSIDNDCDGVVDDGVPTSTWYRDSDADSYGGSTTVQKCAAPSGYVSRGGDCNDANASVHPGATELCDGIDNDCDGQVDEGTSSSTWYYDADGDGVGGATTMQGCAPPAGYVSTGGDCNDGDKTVYPGASELCDGIDNDCDGSIDESACTGGGLQVSGSPSSGSITVAVSGDFKLVFDAAHAWQASGWYDLARDASTNLARSNGSSTNYNVIQSPLELFYESWHTLADARDPSMTIQTQDSSHIVLVSSWSWRCGDGSMFAVSATHTIYSSGAWDVVTRVTNSNATSRYLGWLEYAFTNVRPDISWAETLASSGDTFSFQRTSGTGAGSRIDVQRGQTVGSFDTDGYGNRYWSVSGTQIQAGGAWEVRWRNQL